jgi:hypothetical protein
MFDRFRDKIALSGITVLVAGVALLIFTFINAYGFLTQSLSIMASQDLVGTFGQALAPLIVACIRIMYLGVMGWVGSLLTIRGITIITHLPEAHAVTAQKVEPGTQPQPIQKAETEKPQEQQKEKEKAKPSEPGIIVIPPREVPQALPLKDTQEKNQS